MTQAKERLLHALIFLIVLGALAIPLFKVVVANQTENDGDDQIEPADGRSPAQCAQEHHKRDERQEDRGESPERQLKGGVIVGTLPELEDYQITKDRAERNNQGEVPQNLTDTGSEDEENGQGALHSNGESGSLILGMDLTELGEKQTVTSHLVLDAGLGEHGCTQCSSDYDHGEGSSERAGSLTNAGDRRDCIGDGGGRSR